MNTGISAAETIQRFMLRLSNGDFDDQFEEAFEQLNIFVKREEARSYLIDVYLPELSSEPRTGRRKIQFLGSQAVSFNLPSLARIIVEALIRIYARNEDEELLLLLIEIITKYEFGEFLSVESSGRNLRLEDNQLSFTLRMEHIRAEVKLKLLRLALKKYVDLLIADTAPQELNAVILRLHSVIDLLLKFDDKSELKRFIALSPFTLERISYSPDNAEFLFGQELNAESYEERLFQDYRVPLFPLIASDKLSFEGNKITFKNEGWGVLPSAEIRIIVGEKEFKIGELTHPIRANDADEMFVADQGALATFLGGQTPNLDVKVIVSFRKFGRSYDYSLLSKTVGSWQEAIPETTSLRAMPYEIPLDQLDDKEFERLCEWILNLDPSKTFSNVLRLNESGGGERGRDVLATEKNTGKRYVFQCKRVEKFFPSDIEAELISFEQHVKEDPTIKPDVYVLFVSASISDNTKVKGDALAQRIGMEIEYWTRSTIDMRVTSNPEIEKRFWPLVERVKK